MLRYEKRLRRAPSAPLPDMPLWLSNLLQARGVRSPEEARRFLYPSLEDLRDPMLMQDMDRAVSLIRDAAARKAPVVVFGDYDVDGTCATSVMLETLRDLGLDPGWRIPDRNGDGYGLNAAAVRELAEQYGPGSLMITVDCGITCLDEVSLARQLGMTVIVTDHHEPADRPCPGDAVLNPLLGDYPFRRLCGAGVALKLTEALLGREAMLKRIDLAALATVADLVPLVDENRVIVQEGLRQINRDPRPGIAALMRAAAVDKEVRAGTVAFRMAPRLNAAGRLAKADPCVKLMTTRDEAEAESIAGELNDLNQARQARETRILAEAEALIPEQVNFRTDRAIVLLGTGWEGGVVGLAAGKLAEKYNFPAIVLTIREDGKATGSCRSIPGINIHAMLSTCKDLFERFGGHEMAAGLTLDPALVPELRRRLSLAIAENCDERCYIPVQEYDEEVSLQEATLDMLDRLELLEPTGTGNPPPVFLTRGVQVQSARRMGGEGRHLKASLLENRAVRDAVYWGRGELAETGWAVADAVWQPERNEYRGRVTVQLNLKALSAGTGTAPVPGPEAFFGALLQEMPLLAANYTQNPAPEAVMESMDSALSLLKTGRGTLVVCHEAERARTFLQGGLCDSVTGTVTDPRGGCTVLCAPRAETLTDLWRDIVLADGDLLPGERQLLAERCPHARIHILRSGNPALLETLRGLRPDRERMGTLYRRLRRGGNLSAGVLAEDTGLTLWQVLTGLTVLREAGLAEYTPVPYRVSLTDVTGGRRDLNDSPLYRYLQGFAG